MSCYALGEILGEIILVVLELVLFLLSILVEHLLRSLAFLFVLGGLEECWGCNEYCCRWRNGSSCHFFLVFDVGDVFGHQPLLDLTLELCPMVLIGSFVFPGRLGESGVADC